MDSMNRDGPELTLNTLCNVGEPSPDESNHFGLADLLWCRSYYSVLCAPSTWKGELIS